MKGTPVDDHGQPLNRAFNAARLAERVVDEIIGFSRGVLSDGVVTEGEARQLADWIHRNQGTAELWPVNILLDRLERMLKDGVLDLNEQGELLDLLIEITGDRTDLPQRVANFSMTLPLDRPAPPVVFSGRSFCLTGRFALGSRKLCEAQILSRDGVLAAEPTRKTDYVVIGCMGSAQWIHSTHGRKVQWAVELRAEGVPVAIISEEHWAAALDGATPMESRGAR